MQKSIFNLFLLFLTIQMNAQNAGNALNFDGTDDGVVSISNSGITGTASRTIEAWIKTTEASVQGIIVDLGVYGAATRFTFNVLNGLLRIEIQAGGINGGSVADGAWHHVAVTYDASRANNYELYIDGVLSTSDNLGTAPNTSDGPIRIGVRTDGATRFTGDIDEVRVWNTARTVEEIRDNMHKDLTPSSEANLVAYYKLDETDGATTITENKNGNNGTWSGGGGSNTTSNFETSYAVIGGSTVQMENNIRADWEALGTGNSLESDGLTIAVATTLSETNYAVFGHDDNGVGVVADDLGGSTATQRFSQTWNLEEVGTVDNTTITFDLGSISETGVAAGTASNYILLHRSGSSGNFSDVTTGSSTANTDQVVFTGVGLENGFYTIGTSNSTSSPLSLNSTVSSPEVPTLSEWGLIILALLFMTLGTLYLIQPNFRGSMEKK